MTQLLKICIRNVRGSNHPLSSAENSGISKKKEKDVLPFQSNLQSFASRIDWRLLPPESIVRCSFHTISIIPRGGFSFFF